MDIRILSFLFAFLLLALTRYNPGEGAGSKVIPSVPPAMQKVALREDVATVFRYESPATSSRSTERPTFQVAKAPEGVMLSITPSPSSPSLQSSPELSFELSPVPSPALSPVTVVVPMPSARPTLVLSARNAGLFDLQTGEAIFIKGLESAVPIASISKLMTAVVARETLPRESEFVLSGEDFVGASFHPDLVVGDILTLEEALQLMLLQSDNAVARAVARTYGRDAFVEQMNEKAKELNMVATVFVDPTGIDQNRASTRDLVRLAQYIFLRHPQIFDLTRVPSLILITKAGKQLSLKNTNELVGKLVGLVGGKTGFTDEAGGCLLTVFMSNGRVFISVVLGSSDRFGDTEKIVTFSKGL
ncbi:MAG: D-alanyl-D-alanine carboxypeptidase [Parcubacteria group bacterium]|nr:D-alanyl-D-alanine carboxypeptidase [Parcubacteria group bacterium]